MGQALDGTHWGLCGRQRADWANASCLAFKAWVFQLDLHSLPSSSSLQEDFTLNQTLKVVSSYFATLWNALGWGFTDFSPAYSQTQTIQMSYVHLREKTSIHHNATKPAGRASCCRSGTKPNFTLQAWQWVTGLAHVYCSEIVQANVWMHKLECRSENYEGQPTNKTGNYASSVFQPLWQK